MLSRTRIVLVLGLVLALMTGASPASSVSAAAGDVSPYTHYVSGSIWCPNSPVTIVSHASGTVHHRLNHVTVGVFYNGLSFNHDSSTAAAGPGVSSWEVESVGGDIFKANARCG